MTKEEVAQAIADAVGADWEVRLENGWARHIIVIDRKHEDGLCHSSSEGHYGQLLCCAHEEDMIAFFCPCLRGLDGKIVRFATKDTIPEAIRSAANHKCVPWGG